MGYEHYHQTLSKNVDMKNSEDNNYSIRFKSKTEAIEQLCLKVFGAIPVYESSLEELKEETLESMYAKVVAVALECDPIAAKDRTDGKIEPPWEVFTRVKRERDKLAEENKQLKSQLTQTRGAVTISRNGYVQELEQQRDRLVEAIRIIIADYRLDGRVSAEADILASAALDAVKENQKTDSQSCPECDALASHGSNDGPCETHKL